MIKILLAILGLSYALSPYDAIPDFFVGFGWIDDIIILIILWKVFQAYKKRLYRVQGDRRETRQSSETFGEKESFRSRSRPKESVETKDPHSILGVERNASQQEIKRAYRQLANKYHPDKVSHLGDEFKALAEKRFKEVQDAYQALRVE